MEKSPAATSEDDTFCVACLPANTGGTPSLSQCDYNLSPHPQYGGDYKDKENYAESKQAQVQIRSSDSILSTPPQYGGEYQQPPSQPCLKITLKQPTLLELVPKIVQLDPSWPAQFNQSWKFGPKLTLKLVSTTHHHHHHHHHHHKLLTDFKIT